MSEGNNSLTVLGVEVFFKPTADMDRAASAVRILEERYDSLKRRSSGQSKDLLLTYVALGLADDVLNAQKELDDTLTRIDDLLSKIERLA